MSWRLGANALLVPERLDIGAVYTTLIASRRNLDVNGLIVKTTQRYYLGHPLDVARCGRRHRIKFVSRYSALRPHRPRAVGSPRHAYQGFRHQKTIGHRTWYPVLPRPRLAFSCKVADRANVPLSQIRNIERGVLDPRASTLAAIEQAFDQAGVIFLEVGDTRGGGRGVRLK